MVKTHNFSNLIFFTIYVLGLLFAHHSSWTLKLDVTNFTFVSDQCCFLVLRAGRRVFFDIHNTRDVFIFFKNPVFIETILKIFIILSVVQHQITDMILQRHRNKTSSVLIGTCSLIKMFLCNQFCKKWCFFFFNKIQIWSLQIVYRFPIANFLLI